MNDNSGITDSERLILLVVAVFAVAAGAASLGGFVEPLRPMLIKWQILAEGDDVIIPFGEESYGLGPVPVFVLGGALAIIIVMMLARSRRRRRIK